MSNNDKTLVELPRGDNIIRIAVTEYNGRKGLNIREWYPKNGEMRPTKKGVNIAPDELGKLADAVEQAQVMLS